MGLKAATDQIIDTRNILRNLNIATCNRFGCSSSSTGSGGRRNSEPPKGRSSVPGNGGRRNSVPPNGRNTRGRRLSVPDFYNINDNYDSYGTKTNFVACDGCEEQVSNANQDRFSDDYDSMLLAPKIGVIKKIKSMFVKAEKKTKVIITKSQLYEKDGNPGSEPNDCAKIALHNMYYYKRIKATFKKSPSGPILYRVDVANPYHFKPDAGHIQSRQTGGRGTIANVMPQYPSTNEGNGDGDKKWRQFEHNYYTAINNGNYGDKWELTVTQYGGIWRKWKS
eukprot:35784_1